MLKFYHFNFNVFDLEKSLAFYDQAFGLKPVKEINAEDGAFKIVFLGDGVSDFTLELTWMRDRKTPYNLGDLEYHLAFMTDDYDDQFKKHKAMGAVCFENPEMGIYFVNDPDGYWLEIVPQRG